MTFLWFYFFIHSQLNGLKWLIIIFLYFQLFVQLLHHLGTLDFTITDRAFHKHIRVRKSEWEHLNFRHCIRIVSFNVWVRYFVLDFKGTLWNSTQNIFPIHWKMRSLLKREDIRAPKFMDPIMNWWLPATTSILNNSSSYRLSRVTRSYSSWWKWLLDTRRPIVIPQ